MELKPCPCGKTPKEVLIYGEDRDKWAFAYGDCCGDWHVEFRMHYLNVESKEARKLAAEAWNEARRTDKSPREERLEKALGFYAEPQHYTAKTGAATWSESTTPIGKDAGKIASEALEGK